MKPRDLVALVVGASLLCAATVGYWRSRLSGTPPASTPNPTDGAPAADPGGVTAESLTSILGEAKRVWLAASGDPRLVNALVDCAQVTLSSLANANPRLLEDWMSAASVPMDLAKTAALVESIRDERYTHDAAFPRDKPLLDQFRYIWRTPGIRNCEWKAVLGFTDADWGYRDRPMKPGADSITGSASRWAIPDSLVEDTVAGKVPMARLALRVRFNHGDYVVELFFQYLPDDDLWIPSMYLAEVGRRPLPFLLF